MEQTNGNFGKLPLSRLHQLQDVETSSPTTSENCQEKLQEGIHLIKSDELDLGIKNLQQVINLSNENTDAWFWLGIAAVKQKQLRTAERCFSQAKKYGHSNAEEALQWLQNQGSSSAKNDEL